MEGLGWTVKQADISRIYRRASVTVHTAIRRGDLVVPKCCQECGRKGKLNAHHEDHDDPLCVEWLCTTCHGKTRWGLRRQIGDDLWRAVRARAKREGISLRALILSLLKAWVGRP